MRRWSTAMEDNHYTGDDTREFGPRHQACHECGACVCPDCDGHDDRCSYSPNYYEPPVREIESDEVTR
jgi:hypothetical protein